MAETAVWGVCWECVICIYYTTMAMSEYVVFFFCFKDEDR